MSYDIIICILIAVFLLLLGGITEYLFWLLENKPPSNGKEKK
jgi:flagellar basal body-associated protein FliL